MFKYVFIALVTMATTQSASAIETPPDALTEISASDTLGTQLPLSLPIRDPNGQLRALDTFVLKDRPVVLTFNYMTCPMLCGLQQAGLAEGLKETGLAGGKDFTTISVSIDPKESLELANAAGEKLSGMSGGDWTVLTAPPHTIEALTKSAGFAYTFDEETGQYGHSAVTYILTADGTISQMISGVRPSHQTLRLSIIEASKGAIGNALDQIVLTCLQYDPASATYAPLATGIMRAGGIGIMGSLGIFLGVLWRRERRNRGGGSNV